MQILRFQKSREIIIPEMSMGLQTRRGLCRWARIEKRLKEPRTDAFRKALEPGKVRGLRRVKGPSPSAISSGESSAGGGLRSKNKSSGGRHKPDFVVPVSRDGGHSSGTGVAAGLEQPTRSAFPSREKGRAALNAEPIRPCTGRGLPSTSGRPEIWWALTPPFHPYPAPLSSAESPYGKVLRPGEWRWAVYFLWSCPWGRPRSPLATSLPCGVRTFLRRRYQAAAARRPPEFGESPGRTFYKRLPPASP